GSLARRGTTASIGVWQRPTAGDVARRNVRGAIYDGNQRVSFRTAECRRPGADGRERLARRAAGPTELKALDAAQRRCLCESRVGFRRAKSDQRHADATAAE